MLLIVYKINGKQGKKDNISNLKVTIVFVEAYRCIEAIESEGKDRIFFYAAEKNEKSIIDVVDESMKSKIVSRDCFGKPPVVQINKILVI